jgi:acetone carboxylase gamma subunit
MIKDNELESRIQTFDSWKTAHRFFHLTEVIQLSDLPVSDWLLLPITSQERVIQDTRVVPEIPECHKCFAHLKSGNVLHQNIDFQTSRPVL